MRKIDKLQILYRLSVVRFVAFIILILGSCVGILLYVLNTIFNNTVQSGGYDAPPFFGFTALGVLVWGVVGCCINKKPNKNAIAHERHRRNIYSERFSREYDYYERNRKKSL